MRHVDALAAVNQVRAHTELWLPALSKRRGFSSTRVEHLLNGLVKRLPQDEVYLEVGTLEGLTLEAAANENFEKKIVACDPELKYDVVPAGLDAHIRFMKQPWQDALPVISKHHGRIGCAFYDADHSFEATVEFLTKITAHATDELVVVLDDWDRESVRRAGQTAYMAEGSGWSLLAELPEYTDGLSMRPQYFGFHFGIGVLGWKR